jgi:iron complex outermembrane receptor protein
LASADTGTIVAVNISEQDVATALEVLAKQTSVSVIFSPDITAGIRTKGVSGNYTIEDSVRYLLEGTGLEYEFTSSKTVTLRRRTAVTVPPPDSKGKSKAATDSSPVDVKSQSHDPTVSAQDTALEVIIVTAEKRDVSLQRIGVAITAVTGDELERLGLNDLREMQFLAPGLKIGETQKKTFINIRGIGNELFNAGADQGVAVHMDGVYLARNEYPSLALMDVERVEVLRGPQGTIYGRNATGGAINIITRKPGPDFDAYASITVGNYNSVILSGATGGTVVDDQVFARLAVFSDSHDGWTKNLGQGLDLDDSGQDAARLSLTAIVSENTEMGLSVNYSRDRGNGAASVVRHSATGPGIIWEEFGGQLSTGRNTYSPDPHGLTREIKGVNFNLTHDFGSATLKTTAAYWKLFSDLSDDLDGTSFFTGGEFWGEKQHQNLIEVNLTSNGDGRLEWLAGLFYFGETARTSYDARLFDPSLGDLGFLGGNPDCCRQLNQRGWQTKVSANSYAAFGQIGYGITDSLSLKVGGRYTSDHKREHASLPIFGPPLLEDLSDSWDDFTPRLALEYQANDDLLVYGSVSKGFKSGGFNVWGLQGVGFKPEQVWNYETGLKSRFANGQVQANLTAFYSRYSDLQVNEVLPIAGIRVVNAAAATISGAEIELVARSSAGLQLDVAAAYLNSRFTSFDNFEVDFPELGVQDLSGNRLPKAPEFTINTAAQYAFRFGEAGTVTLRGEYNWQDDVFFTEFNRENAYQPDVGRWNASLAFDSEDETWSVVGFVTNGSNKLVTEGAIIGGQGLGSPVFEFFSPPKLYGVKVSYRFGG